MGGRTDERTERQTDGQMDVGNFSPLYRTLSPIRAAAQKAYTACPITDLLKPTNTQMSQNCAPEYYLLIHWATVAVGCVNNSSIFATFFNRLSRKWILTRLADVACTPTDRSSRFLDIVFRAHLPIREYLKSMIRVVWGYLVKKQHFFWHF